MPTVPDPSGDPVLALRARVARWAARGMRVGWMALGAATVVLVVALVTGTFTRFVAGTVVALLVVAIAVMPPAIVAGYAVRAAAREDPGTSGGPGGLTSPARPPRAADDATADGGPAGTAG